MNIQLPNATLDKQRLLDHIFFGEILPAERDDLADVIIQLCEGSGHDQGGIDMKVMDLAWSKIDQSISVKENGYLNKTYYGLPESTDRVILRQEMHRALDIISSKAGTQAFYVRDVIYLMQAIAEDNMSKQMPEESPETIHVTTATGGYTLSVRGKSRHKHHETSIIVVLEDQGRGIEYHVTYFLSGVEQSHLTTAIVLSSK